MSEDGMDDWAAAMAEQAESEAEQEAGDNEDVQVAELDELTDDAPITQEEKKKQDRKSTRLNSHTVISYAVFCLKKKKTIKKIKKRKKNK